MRSRNRKVNSIGSAGCLGLLALGLMLVNPIITSSAFAEEIPEDEVEETSEEVTDDDVMLLADTPSTVTISFSPSAGSASLSPVNSAGQSAQIKVLATVSVQKSGGYSVYVKSNSQNLVGVKSSSNTIPGLQGSATYANIPVNSWGYYATEGSTVPDNATYKAVSTTGNGDKITENTSNKITFDTKTIALSFAAKINDQKPADTYQNTVTMSVVSSPLATVEDFGISNMQEMTSTICTNAKDNDGDGAISGRLKDSRDGKYYWVSKLADGKCWMVQNLDLDLGTEWPDASLSDYDVANTTYKPVATLTKASIDALDNASTATLSWSLGDYVIINPETSSGCGDQKSDFAGCPSQLASIAGKSPAASPNFYVENSKQTVANNQYDAHYLVGNLYQWNTATAGTGSEVTDGDATGSICPKGWKLPSSSLSDDYKTLLNASGITTDVAKLTGNGLFFVRGGNINQSATLYGYAGSYGYYWTAGGFWDKPYRTANGLVFNGSSNIEATKAITSPSLGASVRCVAR